MSQQEIVSNQILEAVRCAPGCEVDDLVLNLPGLTWNQVFLEIDRLSRTGQVRVTSMDGGTYAVKLRTKGEKHDAKRVSGEKRKEGQPSASSSGLSSRRSSSR